MNSINSTFVRSTNFLQGIPKDCIRSGFLNIKIIFVPLNYITQKLKQIFHEIKTSETQLNCLLSDIDIIIYYALSLSKMCLDIQIYVKFGYFC